MWGVEFLLGDCDTYTVPEWCSSTSTPTGEPTSAPTPAPTAAPTANEGPQRLTVGVMSMLLVGIGILR